MLGGRRIEDNFDCHEVTASALLGHAGRYGDSVDGSVHDPENSVVLKVAACSGRELDVTSAAARCGENNCHGYLLDFKNSIVATESGSSLHCVNSLNSLICHPSMHAPSLASELFVGNDGVLGMGKFCGGDSGFARWLGTARVDGLLHAEIQSVSACLNSRIRGHTECHGSSCSQMGSSPNSRLVRGLGLLGGTKVQVRQGAGPHFAVRTCFEPARVSLPFQRSPLWPASWLPVLDKRRGSKAAEVQRVWDMYDDRLQFMSRDDALNLDDSLTRGDVSSAWLIWSSAVEAALADDYRFAGGRVPYNGLVLGWGVFRSRFVRLGGPKVRRARRSFADPQGGGDVSLYHDVSSAPLLDLRRRFRLVADLLSAMIRDGVSLARSVELAVQWDAILRVGPFILFLMRTFFWHGLVILVSVVRWYLVFTVGSGTFFMLLLSVVGKLLFVVGGVGCVRIH